MPEGTRVEILSESAGWRQVQIPDGKTGYVWGEHLVEGETPPVPEEERAAPATAADLERMRVEIERLTAAQRDLARRLDERPLAAAPPAAPSLESTPGLAVALLLVGGGLGFAVSRLVQRRRDRRQWTKLRL